MVVGRCGEHWLYCHSDYGRQVGHSGGFGLATVLLHGRLDGRFVMEVPAGRPLPSLWAGWQLHPGPVAS